MTHPSHNLCRCGKCYACEHELDQCTACGMAEVELSQPCTTLSRRNDLGNRQASPELKACRQIREALLIEGKNPEYHRAMITHLQRHWPTLWRAVDAAHAAADQADVRVVVEFPYPGDGI